MNISTFICSQDSLILEATADGLSGEQTWPSEAEMNIGDSALANNVDSNVGRNRRIVPTNVRYFFLLSLLLPSC